MFKPTLSMVLNNGKTLDETVQGLKANNMVRLFDRKNADHEIDESYISFERHYRRNEDVTVGEALAAWYIAALADLEDKYDADETMTERQYGAAKAQITKVVFRAKS